MCFHQGSHILSFYVFAFLMCMQLFTCMPFSVKKPGLVSVKAFKIKFSAAEGLNSSIVSLPEGLLFGDLALTVEHFLKTWWSYLASHAANYNFDIETFKICNDQQSGWAGDAKYFWCFSNVS